MGSFYLWAHKCISKPLRQLSWRQSLIIMATILSTTPATAQENLATLATDMFIDGCMKNPGHAQLSILNFTRNRDLTKKSIHMRGTLLTKGSSINEFKHYNGKVSGFVNNASFGPDDCSVVIKKPKNKQAIVDEITRSLLASPLASSKTIKSKKKRKITVHTVKLGAHYVSVGLNLTAKNVVIQLRRPGSATK